MKTLSVPLLALLLLLTACGNPTETPATTEATPTAPAPTTPAPAASPTFDGPLAYPFGLDTTSFTPIGEPRKSAGGDCESISQVRISGEYALVESHSNCFANGTSVTHTLYYNKQVVMEHALSTSSDYFSEIITNYTAGPDPEVYYRSGNPASDRAVDFETETMQDADISINQLNVWLRELTDDHGTHFVCYEQDGGGPLALQVEYVGEVAWRVKYAGQTERLYLQLDSREMTTDGAYPVTTSRYIELVNDDENGQYELTHSGNYDYLVYTRGRDGKVFKFTADNELSSRGEGYRTSPCY